MIQFFCLCTFFLLNLHKAKAFMQHGYEIKDLYETDLSLFKEEVSYWKITPLLSENTRMTAIDIGDNQKPELIIGGPNMFNPKFSDSEAAKNYPSFERAYTGLPPHDYLTLVGKFWYFGELYAINLWGFGMVIDWNSRFALEPIKQAEDFSYKRTNFTEGSVHFDYFKTGFVHNDKNLVVSFYLTTPNLKDRSFGFRDLTIHLSNSSENLMNSNFFCHVSDGHRNLFKAWACKCPLNQAPNASSLCQDCSENCASCYGTKAEQCTSCSEGARWNGAECSKCHWNCKTCTGPTENECSVCNFEYYNYGNGSCLDTCEWPYRIEFVGKERKCLKPCKPGQFLLKHENKCVDKCQPPMVKSIVENDIEICENPCAETTKFLYWNGSCFPLCLQPLIQISNIYGDLCQNPCEGTSKYLYFNRSCQDSCPAPYQVKSDSGVNYCKHPCSNPQYYVFDDGSCHANCPSPPFRVKEEFGVKSCLPPCDLEKEYILGDGSCSKECPSPLIQKIKPGIGTYCLSPCESDNHFVAGNGSCLLNCPNSFDVIIKYGVKYCRSLCSADQYYFGQNKSCLEICPYPLKIRSEAGANLCENPCSGSDDYLYDDKSCQKNCLAPLRIEEDAMGTYCKNPCDKDNKYLHLDGSCKESCDYPYKMMRKGSYQICLIDLSSSQIHQAHLIRQTAKITNRISEIGGLLNSLINTGDPTSLFMIPLLNMLEMIKYMEIVLPGNIELSLNPQRNEEHFRLLKSSKEDLQDIFDVQLRKIGVISLITLLLSGILRVIAPIFNGSKMFKLLQDWSHILQWNLLAPVLISSAGEIILHSIITVNHNGILIFLFGILPLMIFIIYKIIGVGSEIKNIKENDDSLLEGSQLHLQKWKFAFEIYGNERLSQRFFVLIFIIRVVSVSLIIGCFEKYPLGQAVLLLALSFGMVSYLFCASPIHKKMSYIQHLVVEIALLLYNAILVLLVVSENAQNIDVDVKNALGQLMALLLLTTPLLTSIIIVFKLLKNIYDKTFGSNSGSSSGFIQLSEMSHNDDGDEENNVQLHGMAVVVNESETCNDFEETAIAPTAISV